MEQIVYLKWNSIEQRVFLLLLCCLQHPSDVWIKSCVMIGYHVGERWTHLACTGLPALIPGKGKKKKRFIIFGLCHWWSHKKWQKTVLSKKTYKTLVGLMCFNTIGFLSQCLKYMSHSWFLIKWGGFAIS